MQNSAIKLNSPPQWYACEEKWHWFPPVLSDYDLWYVARGSGCMRIGDQNWTIGAGSYFVIPPGAQPHATHDPRKRLLVFACHFSTQMEMTDALCPGGGVVRARSLFDEMAHQAERAWTRGDELGRQQSALWVWQILLLLLEEATTPPADATDHAIEELFRALRHDPGKRWTLDEMAEAVHLSRAQFVRRFRASSGRSPMEFLVQARLDRAALLLQESQLSLAQIADALGYRDAAYFSRQWKEHFGTAPSQVRSRGAKAPGLR